jgi:hypothetical protein
LVNPHDQHFSTSFGTTERSQLITTWFETVSRRKSAS